ncbi:hypothetical protein OG936_27780 [Streptomyces sp. NBC_00846]|uniref:hypothetical protein n=1 Tax=Streptomyces sp. NBC_00846 TaxID=2975849 RepID=UPI00386C29F4|nr:hypothetical protein OG936_27780 [Streptomyces sp. NBC_00846]
MGKVKGGMAYRGALVTSGEVFGEHVIDTVETQPHPDSDDTRALALTTAAEDLSSGAVSVLVDAYDVGHFGDRNVQSGCDLGGALAPGGPREDFLIPLLPWRLLWDVYGGGLGVRRVEEILTGLPKPGKDGLRTQVQHLCCDVAGGHASVDSDQRRRVDTQRVRPHACRQALLRELAMDKVVGPARELPDVVILETLPMQCRDDAGRQGS